MEPEFPGVDFDCEVGDGGDDGVDEFGEGDCNGDHTNSKGMDNQPPSATTCVCIRGCLYIT